ncbi:rhodopsin-like orphan GPCR, putative [Schistosoma mansoni]|uniref:rhodopsin-like orphan GPCR, putative n=1 Tax=Schistosoma mansoni TaxID=6183 RepID=UPI00022C8412|nr:rhodopsin-like orphan GPCR, putative [Schistosoma mansoni]|eukprot:XP_018646117.1 rhodopsin-like orphan GPCR, putative [Schistosoma mansoni]
MLLEIYTTWIDFAKHFVPTALFGDRYVTIIYYILGFPGNFISLIIWSNKKMIKENSAAVYLAALSLNDIIVLIFALNRDLSRVWQIREYLLPGSCEIQNILSPAVQYASPLFVLSFTIERWLAICKPFYIDRICSSKRAIYICILIICSTILVCSGYAYIFITDINTCSKRHINPLIISVYLSCLEAVFSGIVPLLVLLFNCLVIKELAKVHHANKQLAMISNHLSLSSSSSTYCSTSQSNTIPKGNLSRPSYINNNNNNSNNNQCKNKIKKYFKNIFPKKISTNSTKKSSKKINKTIINKNSLNHSIINDTSSLNLIEQYNLFNENNKLLMNGQSNITNTTNTINTTNNTTYNNNNNELMNINYNDSYKIINNKRNNPSFKSTTLMLLTVSFYTILTTLLGGLVYLIHQTQEEPNMNATEKEALKDPVWNQYFKMITIKAFGDEIALSHYAFSFIIYYATGCNFRQRVHQLCRNLLYKLGCRCNTLMKLGINEHNDNIPSITRRSHNRLLTNTTTTTTNNNNNNRQDDTDSTPHISHHRQSRKLLVHKSPMEVDQSLESARNK